jgi:hypothetical protein
METLNVLANRSERCDGDESECVPSVVRPLL